MSASVQTFDLRVLGLKALFFIIATFYFVIFALQGLAIADSGFIVGLSWRIFKGQLPYRDFIYIRPDGSLYLHLIPFLFKGYALAADRLMVIIQLAATALAGCAVLQTSLAQARNPALYWIGASAAFVLTAHNSFFFGWHTIDGVFLGTLGCLFFSRRQWFVAGALAILAGLCKQNFMAIPAFMLLATVMLPRRAAAQLSLGLAVPLAAWIGSLVILGTYSAMVAQVFGAATSADDIVQAGVIGYLQQIVDWTTWKSVGGALAVGLGFWLSKQRRYAALAAYVTFLILAVLSFGWQVEKDLSAGHIRNFGMGAFESSRLIFLADLAVAAPVLLRMLMSGGDDEGAARIKALAVIGLFTTAWASSISWGYAIPAFGGTVFLAPLFLPLIKRSAFALVSAIAVAGLVVFGFLLSYPFGEAHRISDLVPIPPTFQNAALISTRPATVDLLNELNDLRSRYGADRIVILPAFTAATIVLGLVPQAELDMVVDAEIPPLQRGQVAADLCRKRLVAVVDPAVMALQPRGSRFFSEDTQIVLDTWTSVYKSPYLEAFLPPETCDQPRPAAP